MDMGTVSALTIQNFETMLPMCTCYRKWSLIMLYSLLMSRREQHKNKRDYKKFFFFTSVVFKKQNKSTTKVM